MKKLLLLAAISLSTSCGGGGGGGGGTTPPVGGGDDLSNGTLEITEDTVDALSLGISVSEATLQLGQLLAQPVIMFASPFGEVVSDDFCGRGQTEVRHTDSDGDFALSAGDSLTVTWTDCEATGNPNGNADADVNGVANFSIEEMAFDSTSVRLVATVSLQPGFVLTEHTNPPVDALVEGTFRLEFEISAEEILGLRATGNQYLQITVAGASERISEFDIVKTATAPASGQSYHDVDTVVEVDLFFDSEILDGSFTCKSHNWQFNASPNGIPGAGAFTCTGKNSSAVRLVGIRLVELDKNGNGIFTTFGEIQWAYVVEGFLGQNSRILLENFVGDLQYDKLTISTNEVVYDRPNSRFLMTTTAQSPLYANSLVSLSPSSNSLQALLTFSDEPSQIGLSSDSSVIYLSFTDSPEVRKYDVGTLTELSVVTLTTDEQIGDYLTVRDLAVSPTDPEEFVAVFQLPPSGVADVVVVANGIQLPDSPRSDVGNTLTFDRDTRLLYMQDGVRVLADFATLNVSNTGINTWTRYTQATLDGYKQRFGDRIYRGPDVLDGDSLTRLGSYLGNHRAPGVDTDFNFFYSFKSDGNLMVHSLDEFQAIANYNLGIADYYAVRATYAGDGHVLFVQDDLIGIIDASEIVPEPGDECVPESLLTGEQEPYTRYACAVMAIAYDSLRDKLYVATESTMGVNGNSIAVIDVPTETVEDYVYVGSEPLNMAISGDGNYLNVVFSGSELITTLNLNTRQIIRSTEVPPAEEFAGSGLERRWLWDVDASPVENNTVVVQTSFGPSSTREYFAYRDGALLPDYLSRAELLSHNSISYKRDFLFSDTGQLYVVSGDDNQDTFLETANLTPTGLSFDTWYSVPGAPSSWNWRASMSGNTLVTVSGSTVDTVAQSGEARFDIGLMSGRSALTAEYVVTEAADDSACFLTLNDSDEPVIARYVLSTGEFQGEQVLDDYFSFYGDAGMITVGTDHLAFASRYPHIGMIVIDKQHLN